MPYHAYAAQTERGLHNLVSVFIRDETCSYHLKNITTMSLVNNFKVRYNEKRHEMPLGVAGHFRDDVGGAVMLNPAMLPALEGNRGARHYPPTYSRAAEWKCSMRINQDRKEYGGEANPGGRKYVSPPKPGVAGEWGGGRRRNDEQANRRGVQIKGLSVNFKSLKHFPPRGEPGEYDMESYMNRKQRPGRSMETMRNGIPVAVPGDRAFKKVEHEPGYYAKGGLIPGSSIQLRKSAKPEMRGGEETTKVAKRSPKLSYKEKQRRAEEADAKKAVYVLTNEATSMGQPVPSFETRTGAYLVKPEDEAY